MVPDLYTILYFMLIFSEKNIQYCSQYTQGCDTGPERKSLSSTNLQSKKQEKKPVDGSY